MGRKSLEEIYEEVDRESELDTYDREDLRLKDQDPYVIIGRSQTSGNILLKSGDELGYDVVISLTFPQAMKLIKDLTNAVIDKYTK
tara:strand:+ start:1226 stop:1483 length:258 start_codon:yes stop_codon:yes gene_type:complete